MGCERKREVQDNSKEFGLSNSLEGWSCHFLRRERYQEERIGGKD